MMKKIKLLLLFLVTTIGVSWAQIKVTGTVNSSDDNGPMPGVTILENGTSNGTVTDVNGTFSLNVASEASILTFSFVGYSSKEVPVANLTHIDVTLDLDVTELKEIVVIGYGQAKKEDLTGAIASVESKDFNKGVLTSPQDLLVGRLAGVQVTTNSGAPGAGATIRIRGGSSLTASNDPLIVIDGVPIDNSNVTGISNPLATINPNDIESFTVLKDASATAIYGSRASNGVIIITTKKGGGDQPSFAYNSRVSISQPIEYVDVLDGDEYRTLINQLYEDGFSGINQTAVDLLGDDNTDWQDKIFRTAISHDHNLSASGTLATIPYRVSYGYTDQQGILKTTSTKRHSISLNLSPSLLNDNLKVNVNIKQSLAATNFGDEGAVGSAVNYDPTQPVFSGSDAFGGFFNYLNGARPNTFVSNPLAMLKLRNNTADVNRFIGSVKFNYTLPFFKELSASLNLGLDKSRTVGVDDALPGTTWIYRDLADEFAETGRLLDYEAGNQSELLDFYLNYKKEVGVHELEVTAGYSWQHFSRDGFTFSRSGDEGFVIQSKEDTQFENENYLVSFFGRLNYILADKYLITATVRNDGSSRFVGDNQWGLFPALGLAWRISEEGFMSSVSAISSLKLRAGIGVTGQQDISNVPNPYYPGLPIYRESIGGASYQFGDEFVKTLRPNPYDVNIKWEETTTYNVGLDFGILNDRFYGAIEWYRKETSDLINRIPIPGGSNFSNFLVTNVGETESNGLEVSLNGTVVSSNDITWNAGVNFTSYSNKITKLTLVDDPDYPGVAVGDISGGVGNTVQIHTVGFPANSFYVFEQVYDESGNPVEGLYVDLSGEQGEVSSNQLNKYRYKNPAPELTFGINSRVDIYNFDFSFSGRISLNNYVYNNIQSSAILNELYLSTEGGFFTNIPSDAADIGFASAQYWSDLYVENASFFKLDNISLGYTLPITEAIDSRVSFTVQNALIVTKYSGLDPEVNGGIDNNIYPRPRTFLLGVGLNF